MDTNLTAATSYPRWRFSLKHLLVALGLVCLLLAPFHYFGGIYLFSIFFSLLLSLVCVFVYRASVAGSVIVSFVGLFFGFLLAMVFLTFGVHAFFNCLACMVLALASVRARTFAVCLCLTMFAVYGFAIYSGIDEMRELSALKVRFPFESLRSRLAFEDASPSAKPTTDQPIHLVSVVDTNLDEQDKRLGSREQITLVALGHSNSFMKTQLRNFLSCRIRPDANAVGGAGSWSGLNLELRSDCRRRFHSRPSSRLTRPCNRCTARPS